MTLFLFKYSIELYKRVGQGVEDRKIPSFIGDNNVKLVRQYVRL